MRRYLIFLWLFSLTACQQNTSGAYTEEDILPVPPADTSGIEPLLRDSLPNQSKRVQQTACDSVDLDEFNIQSLWSNFPKAGSLSTELTAQDQSTGHAPRMSGFVAENRLCCLLFKHPCTPAGSELTEVAPFFYHSIEKGGNHYLATFVTHSYNVSDLLLVSFTPTGKPIDAITISGGGGDGDWSKSYQCFRKMNTFTVLSFETIVKDWGPGNGENALIKCELKKSVFQLDDELRFNRTSHNLLMDSTITYSHYIKVIDSLGLQ